MPTRRRLGTVSSHSVPQASQTAGGRYEFIHVIGRGAVGAVYFVKDRETGEYVALKRLLRVDADGVLRLKREFRTMADISHRNLVRFYDLGRDDDGWFLTMEYVDGCDLLSYVRFEDRTLTLIAPESVPPPARVDVFGRLVPTFHELACGVNALHRAGMLHRDLKPSNVLVGDGRVVVLDFGLVRSLDGTDAELTADGAIFGTPAYMAPEQAQSQPLTQASDWYAFGAMLYQALTGELPSGTGSVLQILRRKLEETPVPARQLDPTVPEELSQLCSELLARDPERRPNGDAVVEHLEAMSRRPLDFSMVSEDSGTMGTQSQARAGVLFGRSAELERLWSAFHRSEEGSTVVLHVRGASGAGKTALVERFLDDLESRVSRLGQSDVLVLRSRCYEREVMPFKALDSVVDTLVRHLSLMDEVEVGHLLPADISALAQLFPSLECLGAVQKLTARRELVGDGVQVRHRAEPAFRELLGRLASRRPVVLWIDDLHWGDVDSARILKSWLEARTSAPLLLIFGYRSTDVQTSPCLQHLLQVDSECELLEVEPLSVDATRALCEHSLGLEGGLESELVEHIVREAAGSPFLALQLASVVSAERRRGTESACAHSVSDLVERMSAMLSPPARELLAMICIAGRPVAPKLALLAAGIERGGRSLVHELRGLNLVRTRHVDGMRCVEAYHDRIREAVQASLGPERQQRMHGALLSVLEISGRADSEWLYVIAREAGADDEAMRHGLDAARQAMDKLAFERAASLYRECLSLVPVRGEQPRELWEKLAVALASCGRGAAAAEAYLEASKRATPKDGIRFMRLAASHLVRSGHFEEGEALLSELLTRVGLPFPESDGALMASVLWERCRLKARGLAGKPRLREDAPAELLERIDLVNSLRNEVYTVNGVKGALFQVRSLRWSLEAGEPARLAVALASEAAAMVIRGDAERVDELLDRATELAARVESPVVWAAVHANRITAQWLRGHQQKVLALADEAEETLRAVSHHERAYYFRFSVRTFRLSALYDQGHYRSFQQLARETLGEARAAENHMALLQLANIEALSDELLGKPDRGMQRLHAQRARLPLKFGMLHIVHMMAACEVACASGCHEWGLRQLEDSWPAFLDSPFAAGTMLSSAARYYRLRLLFNVAAQSRGRVPKRASGADLVELARGPVPVGSAHRLKFRARAALLDGDLTRGQKLLRQAIDTYDALGCAGEAAAGRLALSRLVSGQESRSFEAAAAAFFRREQVDGVRLSAGHYPEAFREE